MTETSAKPFRYVWLAIVAGLGFFIGGRWNMPLAAWVLPVFLLRFFRDSNHPRRDFFLVWALSALTTIISWQGATAMNFIHPVAEPAFFILTTPLGLLPMVLDRIYHRRFGSAPWLLLVYPLAAAGMDYFTSSGSPFGTFGAAAYSQRGFLPAVQTAAYFGLWALPFLMACFASAINDIWENGWKRPSPIVLALLGLTLLLGGARVMSASQAPAAPRIAGFSLPNGKLGEIMPLLQAKKEQEFRTEVEKLHTMQLARVRELARQGAQIVVLQEGAGMGYPDQVEVLLQQASQLATEEKIYLVLPTFKLGIPVPENVLYVIDPQGKLALRHVKYGGNQFEGSLKGDGVLQTLDTPYGKISAVICWDADFPEIIRQAGQQQVALLFIPANDWFEVRDIHAGMSTFRAIENGLTIFRQTGQGVSVVSDAYGRETSRVDSFAGNSEQFATVPVAAIPTPYIQVGDAFGQTTQGLLALLTLGGLGLVFMRKRQ